MNSIFSQIGLLKLTVFLASALFFFIGYGLAPLVYHKNIRWLLAYPMWMAEKIEKWSKQSWHPGIVFLFIFSMNLISLSIDFFSGMIPLLPVLFAVWTGLNVGLVSFHTLEGEYFYASLFNPVSLVELPAVFTAFTLAFQYNAQFFPQWITLTVPPLKIYIHAFLTIVTPLLLLGAFVETALIKFMDKMQSK
jgi:xanthine/uracil permease